MATIDGKDPLPTAAHLFIDNPDNGIYHEIMKRHIPTVLLILIISLALYANTLKNGFVYDDEGTVVNNILITDLGNIVKLFDRKAYFSESGEETYRPFVTFTYFLDYALYGLKPWGYHLTNILLHAINGVLFYAFLTLIIPPSAAKDRELTSSFIINAPLISSLFFITHPVLTEAINAVSFREDLLTTFFYLMTLNIYIFMNSKSGFKYGALLYLLSCLTFIIGLLSKEMAVTLPIVILCYEWTFIEEMGIRVLLNLRNTGYFACLAAYGYLRFFYFYNPSEANIVSWQLTERVLTIPWVFINFLKLTLFPVSLSADYEIAPIKNSISSSFILPIIILTLLAFAAWSQRKKQKHIAFGISFFFITLLPVSNIIPIINPFAERYLYLPSIGFAIVIGVFLNYIYKNLKLESVLSVAAIFIILLAIYSFMVISRNKVWRDDYSLWSDAVRKLPNNSWPRHNLGILYSNQGRLDEAIRELKTAIGMKSTNPTYYYNLGIIYFKKGQMDRALEQYKTVSAQRPNYPDIHYQLGLVYNSLGNLDKAMQEYKMALSETPYSPSIHNNIGFIYFKRAQFNEASQEYMKALQLKPDYVLAFNNLGNLYYVQGKTGEFRGHHT